MSNVIQFPMVESRLHCIYDTITYILKRGQSITIGSSNPELRAKELRLRFPNAKVELVDAGVKVSCPK